MRRVTISPIQRAALIAIKGGIVKDALKFGAIKITTLRSLERLGIIEEREGSWYLLQDVNV